jgi:hypothetical protein
MFTRAFLKYAVERAIKTAAQTMISALSVSQTNVIALNWAAVADLAGAAAVASLLTSLAVLSGAPDSKSGSDPSPATDAPATT